MGLRKRSLSGWSVSPAAIDRRGSILIIVLWSLCLLTTFAVSLGYGVRQKATLAKRLDEREKLYLFAEAGAKKAIVEITNASPPLYDALNSWWSNNRGLFQQISLGDGEFSVSVVDEERKININKADLNTLERLFRVLGLDDIQAQELAASIIDWRDRDSQLSIPLGSAEDSYYRNLKYPYEAKDSEYEILEEVLLVKDMTEDIFNRIEDYITVYGDGKINVNTASKPVLLALGLSEDIVDKIMLYRLGEDLAIGTSDDNVFPSAYAVTAQLSQSFNLSASEVAQITAVSDQSLVALSNNFMIRSVGKLRSGKDTMELTCVVSRDGSLLRWQGL